MFQLFEYDNNFVRLNQIEYNVFATSLVWPKMNSTKNNNVLKNVKNIFEFLVEKNFKIFNENSKFENETFLDSLLHVNNPYDNNTKMILYDYFIIREWNNPRYCYDLLNTFVNLLNDNMQKYSYIINFLSFKNVEVFLKILYNKISFKFSDEVKVILDCLILSKIINRYHFFTKKKM